MPLSPGAAERAHGPRLTELELRPLLGRAPEKSSSRGKTAVSKEGVSFPGDPEGLFPQTQRECAWGAAPLRLPNVFAKQPLCVVDFCGIPRAHQNPRATRDSDMAPKGAKRKLEPTEWAEMDKM